MIQIIEKCKGYPLNEISIPATNVMMASRMNNNCENLCLWGIRSAYAKMKLSHVAVKLVLRIKAIYYSWLKTRVEVRSMLDWKKDCKNCIETLGFPISGRANLL
jgi:hypothetical protein